MKMKMGDVYALYCGIKGLGIGDKDSKVSLKSDIRFDLAIDLSRLEAMARGYEIENAKTTIELSDGKPFLTQVAVAKLTEADHVVREKEMEVPELKKIKRADLKLDENANITIATIQQLAPIISDWEG